MSTARSGLRRSFRCLGHWQGGIREAPRRPENVRAPWILTWILATLLAGALVGCHGERPVYTAPLAAFGTSGDLSLVDIDVDTADEIRRQIEQDLAFIDRHWRAWGTSSLERVNGILPTGETFIAPPSIVPVVLLSQRLAEQSGGLFNPATGKLIDLWGFRGNSSTCGPPPDPSRIRKLVAASPQMSDIRVDGLEMAGTNPAVRLDLEMIATGYGIDLAIATVREQGIRSAMVRIGDDLRAIGDRAGKPWRVAIRRPTGSAVYGIIEIHDDESLFTTGDYERNFVYEGKIYHHVLDPRTGYPATGTRAVTVIHREAARADAAARALLIAGPDRWEQAAASMGIEQVLLFDRSGTVRMSSAMAARIQRLDENTPVRISRLESVSPRRNSLSN